MAPGGDARHDRAELACDAVMVVLALLSVALVFYYDTTDDPETRRAIVVADWVFVAVFVGDFLWDLRRAPDRRAFLRRNWWAPLGMVPLAVSEMAAFRLLRLFRVLRALRAFRALQKFFGATQRALAGAQVARLAIISGTIMVAGSVMVWFAERGSNPELATYGEALWWAVVTVTTVGYGDVTPITTLGRVIAGGLMITGIGTIGLLAGQVGAGLIGKPEEPGEAAAPVPVRAGSVAERLAQLAALREKGLLTEAEFAQAKDRVLREP